MGEGKTHKKITEPPCTVTERNEPNLELMARAFLDLYNKTRHIKRSQGNAC